MQVYEIDSENICHNLFTIGIIEHKLLPGNLFTDK